MRNQDLIKRYILNYLFVDLDLIKFNNINSFYKVEMSEDDNIPT